MPLPEQWAKPEDFATLFQYFWHRDFPIDQKAIGARRVDWTIHIGIIVRSIADLMGLVTRFERGGRKDAVLRSSDGDEIAIEWEWEGIEGNELEKLKSHKVWPRDRGKKLKYAVLITYSYTNNIEGDYEKVKKRWETANWPLLLILIDSEQSKEYTTGRVFNNIRFYLLDPEKSRMLRDVPALPWNIESSRWYFQVQ